MKVNKLIKYILNGILATIICSNASFAQKLIWEQKFSSSDLYYRNMAIDSTDNVYVLASDNIILFSSDFGENWDQINLPFINDPNNIDIAADKYNHIYLTRTSISSPGIFKSTDSGSTWFPLNFWSRQNCIRIIC